MSVELRRQALSLYRRLLRAAREWKGSTEEADYIRQEARQQFRANRLDARSEAAVAQALEEGEKRLELALHYGIAFPRLHHADQFAKTPYWDKPRLGGEPEEVASGIRDRSIADKLAAAARRRREKLAAQQQQQQHGDGGAPE
ncbi:LYR motif-containing 1 [Chlorella sorokiniana]|uniref:LYR motif-containing 1 n=1 Tax=Chlorella sorokiniana TaxID=3076 RepID=A0A2P6TWZ5_CHLSO|nr:LYR motif-containing 1 [Chlorella sorokiniana]|eukprot:PRW58577.1 LYR motif-containing 1 [Chlorella sorokiniana]